MVSVMTGVDILLARVQYYSILLVACYIYVS